ncbi:MAG: TIR domain-containing protein [Pirellulales bacterium]
MTKSKATRQGVFVSYSHKDERWLERLIIHLRPYLRNGSITYWSDKQIEPGAKWMPEIVAALRAARVAVLLVTPDFLNSDFINQHELAPLLTRAEKGGVVIIWVPVRACAYDKCPIANYQSAFDPSRPLAKLRPAMRDEAWVSVCKSIEAAVNKSGGRKRKKPAARKTLKHPALRVAMRGAKVPSHRPLMRDIERSVAMGPLRNSSLAPTVLEVLTSEASLTLARRFESALAIRGIQLSDEYFARVSGGAGMRDWQRDFAQTARPTLVGIAKVLAGSADVQAVIVRLCNEIAKRLRLRLIWPKAPDKFNDAANGLYRACLAATELESDDVLVELKGLRVVGPK